MRNSIRYCSIWTCMTVAKPSSPQAAICQERIDGAIEVSRGSVGFTQSVNTPRTLLQIGRRVVCSVRGSNVFADQDAKSFLMGQIDRKNTIAGDSRYCREIKMTRLRTDRGQRNIRSKPLMCVAWAGCAGCAATTIKFQGWLGWHHSLWK